MAWWCGLYQTVAVQTKRPILVFLWDISTIINRFKPGLSFKRGNVLLCVIQRGTHDELQPFAEIDKQI